MLPLFMDLSLQMQLRNVPDQPTPTLSTTRTSTTPTKTTTRTRTCRLQTSWEPDHQQDRDHSRHWPQTIRPEPLDYQGCPYQPQARLQQGRQQAVKVKIFWRTLKWNQRTRRFFLTPQRFYNHRAPVKPAASQRRIFLCLSQHGPTSPSTWIFSWTRESFHLSLHQGRGRLQRGPRGHQTAVTPSRAITPTFTTAECPELPNNQTT